MDDIKRLRQTMRSRRQALTSQEVAAHSAAMVNHLTRSRLFLRSRRLAAYMAANGEIDPAGILDRAMMMGKRCFLPVLRAHPKNTLWFSEYRQGDALQLNHFGILEPSIHKRALVPPWGLDLMLLPLVAFDMQGNRMGMGGGYYDKTLAYLRRRSCWRSPRLIGVAYEMQKVDALKVQSWDVPLQGVVTEADFYQWD